MFTRKQDQKQMVKPYSNKTNAKCELLLQYLHSIDKHAKQKYSQHFLLQFLVPSIILLVSHPMIHYFVASQISPSTALLLFWVDKMDEKDSPVKLQ